MKSLRPSSLLLALAVLAASLWLLLSPALAQPIVICGQVKDIAATLLERYDERAVSWGFDPEGNVLMVYASPDGHTWTALLVRPSGSACIKATGTDWSMARFALRGERS